MSKLHPGQRSHGRRQPGAALGTRTYPRLRNTRQKFVRQPDCGRHRGRAIPAQHQQRFPLVYPTSCDQHLYLPALSPPSPLKSSHASGTSRNFCEADKRGDMSLESACDDISATLGRPHNQWRPTSGDSHKSIHVHQTIGNIHIMHLFLTTALLAREDISSRIAWHLHEGKGSGPARN